VSEVDVNGRVLSTFTDVELPLHLSLNSEGRVLVADSWNDRILLLSSHIQLQRVLVKRNSNVDLWQPTLLCHNELTSQLYVVRSSERLSQPDVISVFSLLHWRWVTDSSLLQSDSLGGIHLWRPHNFSKIWPPPPCPRACTLAFTLPPSLWTSTKILIYSGKSVKIHKNWITSINHVVYETYTVSQKTGVFFVWA